MTFSEETPNIGSRLTTATVDLRLKRSLLFDEGHVNKNGVATCGSTSAPSLQSIPVGKTARAVVIPSDMTKQMADKLPKAGHAFREWRREERH